MKNHSTSCTCKECSSCMATVADKPTGRNASAMRANGPKESENQGGEVMGLNYTRKFPLNNGPKTTQHHGEAAVQPSYHKG